MCLLRLAFGSALEQPPPGERETALPDTNLFRQEGKMWRIRFDGLEVSTPNEAGMTYIAHLLLNAWQDIHVFKLASLRSANRLRRESAHEDIAALGADGGSYDPVLDRSALESYRARLHELDAARKLAEQNGDQIGLAEIDREYAGTERELKRATGLGGRARTFQGEMGRARQRVSRAIDRARVTISKGHAPLGRHLDAFVSTGKHCAYKPEPPTHWSP